MVREPQRRVDAEDREVRAQRGDALEEGRDLLLAEVLGRGRLELERDELALGHGEDVEIAAHARGVELHAGHRIEREADPELAGDVPLERAAEAAGLADEAQAASGEALGEAERKRLGRARGGALGREEPRRLVRREAVLELDGAAQEEANA